MVLELKVDIAGNKGYLENNSARWGGDCKEKKTDRREEKRAGRGRSGKGRDKEQSGKDN